MHRCLAVNDVVVAILNHLGDDEDISEADAATLSALAVTCRAFQEPALDLLWRSMRALEPVMKCLPGTKWSSVNGDLRFENTIGADDWERFDYYAKRIKQIKVSEEHPNHSLANSLEILSQRGVPVLFPKLSTLNWYSHSVAGALHLRTFFGPALKQFTLSCHNRFAIFESSLTYLPGSSPSLEHLALYFGHSTFTPNPRFPVTLGKLSRLRHLTLELQDNWPFEVVNIFPMLENLEELNVGCLGPSSTTQAEAPGSGRPPTQPLPALKRLTITDTVKNNLGVCSLFLRAFPPPNLEVLIIDTEGVDAPTPASVVEFLHTVAAVVSATSLQCLRIASYSPVIHHRTAEASRVHGAAFQPLFKFRGLLQLDFSIPPAVQVVFDDLSLEQMANAWPLLGHLSIQAEPRLGDALPSSDALCTLVQHCSHLSHLMLNFDMSNIVSFQRQEQGLQGARPANGATNKNLEYLWVQSSRIQQPLKVAAFLLSLLPNLRHIVSADECEEGGKLRWKEVEDALPTLAVFREWNSLTNDLAALSVT